MLRFPLRVAAVCAARPGEGGGATRYVGEQCATGTVRSTDNVHFEWSATNAHRQWQLEVSARYDHAVQRGIPRPKAWPQMVRCAIADAVAHETSANASFGAWASEVDCAFLGAPVRVQLHEGAGVGTGSVVSLKSSCVAGRRWYLTVAHVIGDLWLCADGSSDGSEEILLDRLFSEDVLQLKNLVTDAWVDPTSRPHKRVRLHVKAPQVRAAALAYGWRFSQLVAGAKWRAEDIRSGLEGRGFDLRHGSAGYTTDPLRWHAGGWDSQTQVAAAWRWRSHGELHQERITSSLNHWPQRRAIPLPRSMQPATETDQEIWEGLLKAAEQAASDGFAPCAYLGLHAGEGQYEPDPAKWPSGPRELPKQRATVFYEWLHVKQGLSRRPYRVPVCVESILRQKVALPNHPLSRAAHGGLCFSMRFLDEFAERRWPGLRYRGVTFDNQERPEIYEQLPNGGSDTQHHPVYWALPCGSRVCMSLRELYLAKPDAFLPQNSREAYREVASELHFDVLGVAAEEQVAEFTEDPGALADQKWLLISWKLPENEASPCWHHWANKSSHD